MYYFSMFVQGTTMFGLTSGKKNFRIFSQTVFFNYFSYSTVLKCFQKLSEDVSIF